MSELPKDYVVPGVKPPGALRAGTLPKAGASAWLASGTQRLVMLGSVDLRSLAVVRIGLAIMIIVDLATRWGDLTAHYTDAGVLPRALLFESEGLRAYLSLHSLHGSSMWQAILFATAGYFAITMLLGVRTRLATFGSWVLLLSLHHRNPVVLQSGDALLRLLLFWGMLLPLGARWSLDSTSGPLTLYRRKDNRLLSVAGVAILLQVCLVYWFTATFKDHPMWWNQNAAYFALHVDQLVTPFGMWLRQIDWLLPILTKAAFTMAIAAPLLVFCPFWTGKARMIVILAMIGTHLALAMSLNLGLLPYVAAMSWLVFIPSSFWDGIKKRFRRHAGLRVSPTRTHWLLTLIRRIPILISVSRRGTGDVLIDIPTSRRFAIKARGWEQVLACIALLYAVAWNLQWLDSHRDDPILPVRITATGDILRMEQNWNMLSPDALSNDDWFVMPAQLINGEKVDAFTGGQLSWTNPVHISENQPSSRWRKYLRNLSNPQFDRHLAPFAEYVARSFNETHSTAEQIVSFDIVFIRETTRPSGGIELNRYTLLQYHDGS